MKTHYMIFHQAILKPTTDALIRHDKIALVKNTKFIGIIIYDKLKWTNHIRYNKNKISKLSGILIKTKNNLYFFKSLNNYITHLFIQT